MLLLNPKEEKCWRTHQESGAKFLILPADSVVQNDMEARAKRAASDSGGDFFSQLARIVAAERVVDWQGVGTRSGVLPCTPENRVHMAAVHENSLMPWLVREVRDLANFIAEEETAAKNG